MSSAEVVSCPGCGKRYSVPPGVPPGQFQCQDCHAVVAYGGAPPSTTTPAGPAGRGSARKHAKAAAARRRVERSREREYDDDDRGPRGPAPRRSNQNPVVYLSGFLVLAIVAGATAYWVVKTKEQERKEREEADRVRAEKKAKADEEAARVAARIAAEEAEIEAQAAKGVPRGPSPGRGTPSPSPSPTPSPGAGGGLKAEQRSGAVVTGEGAVKFVDEPPTGGNYGKTQSEILFGLKKDRSQIVTDLPHLPDTPADLRSQIDADVKAIADPNAGGAAIAAEERLMKTGRAAIPRVLGVTADLDFSKYKNMADARDACVVASSVDRILREITGYTVPPRLQFTPEGRIDEYPVCIDEWYTWWLATGYKRATFYKTEAPAKPEDERL